MATPSGWRASWKGFLSLGALSCGVALYAAASTSERIALHLVNRETGGRLRRKYVDEDTGETVEAEDQVRGYEIAKGDYIPIEADEIDATLSRVEAAPAKTIKVDCFLACDDLDMAFLDRPYFIAATDKPSAEVLALFAQGMTTSKVAALGEAMLFGRLRHILIRPATEGGVLFASTLHFDYEIRLAEKVMADMPAPRISREMRDLAVHIIQSKRGLFDPAGFEDRYEKALAKLVRAKVEGRPLPQAPARRKERTIDLMAALRSSAGLGKAGRGRDSKPKSENKPRNKARPPGKTRRPPAAKRDRKAG
jgi:DNA end-binding protein Ku